MERICRRMRLIDLDELLQYPLRRGSEHCDEEHANPHFLSGVESVLEFAQTLPAINQPNDFTPVRHGRWIKPAPGDGENYCSVCHAEQPWFYGYGYYNSDYCPNCGACMDVKEALKDADN